MVIEPVRSDERESLLRLAVRTELFTSDEADGLLGGVLDSLAAGSLPEGHAAVACRASTRGQTLGWSYFAPDPYADGVWNLWWIGVAPEHRGSGAGRALLSHAEARAAAAGARILVIETSDRAPLASARRFYASAGYAERGRIPHFYADGDAKVVFSRSLARLA